MFYILEEEYLKILEEKKVKFKDMDEILIIKDKDDYCVLRFIGKFIDHNWVYNVNINNNLIGKIKIKNVINIRFFYKINDYSFISNIYREVKGGIIEDFDFNDFYIEIVTVDIENDLINKDFKTVYVYHNKNLLNIKKYKYNSYYDALKIKYYPSRYTVYGEDRKKLVDLIDNNLIPKINCLYNQKGIYSSLKNGKNKIKIYFLKTWDKESIIIFEWFKNNPTLKLNNYKVYTIELAINDIDNIAIIYYLLQTSHTYCKCIDLRDNSMIELDEYLSKKHFYYYCQSIFYKNFNGVAGIFYKANEVGYLLREWTYRIDADVKRKLSVLTYGNDSHLFYNEQILYLFIKSHYKDALFQYRSEWLQNLTLDIYIPQIKVGIEYQGIQHYIPVDYFGGEIGLKERKQRDNLKKILCEKNNIKLIEWTYDDYIDDYTFNIKFNNI